MDISEEEHTVGASQWVDWLDGKRAHTAAGYGLNPDWMKGHCNGERSTARDYANRELLELVQNAADAAMEAGGHGKVRIEVTRQGLCVANTGEPFRKSGVASLMTAHTSDKPDRKTNLIGAKGLGFRSLLNWSAEPYVSSGSLEIAFSQTHAIEVARKIAADYPQLDKLLEDSATPPVPILAFPAYGTALLKVKNEVPDILMARANQLRADNYDTVVVVVFDSPDAFEAAVAQVREFKPDFLLFVEALDEISFGIEGRPEATWRKLATGSNAIDIEINTGGVITTDEWFCLRSAGELPDPDDSEGVRPYELAIAIRRNGPTPANKLHCYFPTEVHMPLPALFHATLELDSNRKSLNGKSPLNEAVLAALANFYSDMLVELTANKSILDPLAYLGRRGMFPDPLRGFGEAVRIAASTRPLVPTLAAKRVAAAQTALGPANYSGYLPRKLFKSLAKCSSDAERSTLEWLGVQQIDPTEMIAVLKQAELTVAERAKAIAGIAANVNSGHHDSGLVIDAAGKPLSKTSIGFPPPVSGKPPQLPKWAKAKFLDRQLWDAIVIAMPGNGRARFDKLQHFHVNEFNAAGVISSLRTQANRAIRLQPDRSELIQQEYLSALFTLRKTVAKDGSFKVDRRVQRFVDSEFAD